jgi:predicted oxidoreductase (fatty acid repression mutant protein)
MGLKSLLHRPGHQASKSPVKASTRSVASSSSSVSQAPSSKQFLDAVRARRTVYALNKSAPIADTQIESVVKETILHTPSAFNSQTARLVVLLNKEHDTFWELVKASLKPLVSEEQFETTSAKLDGFKAGYGTVLFYEDQDIVHGLEENFKLYADKFQQWSEHTSAMHQLVLWTALEAEGFGANLQHYNPVVDDKAAEQWGVPKNWNLKAQLVFGGRVEGQEPGEKQFKAVEGERLRVFGQA